MINPELQSLLSTAANTIEAAYHSLNATSTNSDLESKIKEKLLIRIKNSLTEAVIQMDMVDEINNNPDDTTSLEAILELISDTQEMLS